MNSTHINCTELDCKFFAPVHLVQAPWHIRWNRRSIRKVDGNTRRTSIYFSTLRDINAITLTYSVIYLLHRLPLCLTFCVLMYPLSWFVPITKPFSYSPIHFSEALPHISDNSAWNILSPLYDMSTGWKKTHLRSVPLFFCAVELLVQFILFRVLYDHVRFSCRIFISLLPQPWSSPAPLACLLFLPPTFPPFCYSSWRCAFIYVIVTRDSCLVTQA